VSTGTGEQEKVQYPLKIYSILLCVRLNLWSNYVVAYSERRRVRCDCCQRCTMSWMVSRCLLTPA